MPSPFVGMDPYLEASGLWPDFHSTFINCWREALLDVLPENYDARLEERVYVVELPEEAVPLRIPDVAIERTQGSSTGVSGSGSASATLAPVAVPLFLVEEVREVSIRILHRPDQTLVSSLELLSPSNKSSSGQAVYLEKRTDLIRSPVHLVELDLLLGGERLPMGAPLPAGHFFALVSRANRRPYSEVYAWTVRDPLPAIPIPLKQPDPDVIVDLSAIFQTAYARGRYQRAIDYRSTPRLPLEQADSDWVAQRASSAVAG